MRSERIHQEFYKYLRKHLNSVEEVKELIQRNGMEVFFPETINNKDMSAPKALFNKIRFERHRTALKQIKNLFDENGISFVVMKGVVLAMDLYGNEPYMRTFWDLDILVSPSQLALAVYLLESIGYKSTDSISVDSFLKALNREHHFPPLERGDGFWKGMAVEVHTDIVPAWLFQKGSLRTEEIISRRHVNEFDIPTMDDYDTIIFLMLHLVKHYVFDCSMGFINGNVKPEINLRLLHEVALFTDKRQEGLERGMLKERACEYGMGNELAFVSGLLTEIYPSLRGILDIYIPSDMRGCLANRLSQGASEMGVERILFGDKRGMICDLISKLQKDAYRLPCYMKKEGGVEGFAREINIDALYYHGDNRFGTYQNVPEGTPKAICHGTFYVDWDREFFWFHIFIRGKKFIFLSCDSETQHQVIGMQDYVRLHFDTGRRGDGEAFVRGIILKPQYNGDYGLKVFLKEDIMGNNAETVLEETEYVATAEYDGEVCQLEVGIPWRRLGYKPEGGFTFFFDVQILEYHEEVACHVPLTWQDAYKPWYDITTYACVELKV